LKNQINIIRNPLKRQYIYPYEKGWGDEGGGTSMKLCVSSVGCGWGVRRKPKKVQSYVA